MQILWNGELSDKFYPSREITQGDPISLYLFVLCIERLAQSIITQVSNQQWILV